MRWVILCAVALMVFSRTWLESTQQPNAVKRIHVTPLCVITPEARKRTYTFPRRVATNNRECVGKVNALPCSNNSGSCMNGVCDVSGPYSHGCSGAKVETSDGVCVTPGAACKDTDRTNGFYDLTGTCKYAPTVECSS